MALLKFLMELDTQYYLEVKKYDFIYNSIWYLTRIKRGITYVCSHNFAKVKVDLYGSLSLEKNIDFL